MYSTNIIQLSIVTNIVDDLIISQYRSINIDVETMDFHKQILG